MGKPEIGTTVVVDVPATTANLGPGFDCLGAALDLNNQFQLKVLEGGAERFELIIESKEGSHLRGGPDNLVYRAAQRVWREVGMQPIALEARVQLAVPPARGMGSSATAIVAGLMGANALAGEALGKEKLLELAIDIEGHPDNVVPSLLQVVSTMAMAIDCCKVGETTPLVTWPTTSSRCLTTAPCLAARGASMLRPTKEVGTPCSAFCRSAFWPMKPGASFSSVTANRSPAEMGSLVSESS